MVPKVTEAAEDEHVEVEVKVPAAKAVEQTTAGHDHAKDHDPEEGTNCLHVRPCLLPSTSHTAVLEFIPS